MKIFLNYFEVGLLLFFGFEKGEYCDVQFLVNLLYLCQFGLMVILYWIVQYRGIYF